MRRLTYLFGTAVIVALAVLVPVKPAAAAPDLCLKEWANPLRWKECTDRVIESAQDIVCLHPPTPDDPTTGIGGWAARRPEWDLRPGVKDRATEYGLGGYQLSTYDQGCAAPVTDAEDRTMSSLATGGFSLATVIVGTGNALREWAYSPRQAWGWSDTWVAGMVDRTYRYVFTPFGVIGLALVGVWLVWRSRAGNLSEAAQTVGWALVVLVAVTAVFRWPLWIAQTTDGIGSSGLEVVTAATGQGPEHLPAERCPNNPQECVDSRTAAGRASATTVDVLLYRNWLRAQLGSADSNTARDFGPVLYDAQTLTWAEAAQIREDPTKGAEITKQKGQQWRAAASQIKRSDPAAYSHLQGEHGWSRMWASVVAVLSALVFSVFDVAASLIILFGFLAVRLTLMLGPMLATIGVFRPASGPLRRVVDLGVGGLWNVFLFGALSGAYLSVTSLLFATPLPGPVQLAMVGIGGWFFWLLRSPARRAREVLRLRRPNAEAPTANAKPQAVAA